jgi:ribosomal protein S18 acetylase RimI-like enzyme
MIVNDELLSIRWYQPRDLQQATDLHDLCLPGEEWKPCDFVRFANNQNRRNAVKVLSNESGLVYGTLLYTLEGKSCRIRRVTIDPSYQRQGLGTYMVSALITGRWLVRQRQYTARVSERDLRAQLFLQHLGFVFNAELPRERDGENDIYLFTFDKIAAPVPAVA